MYWERTGRGAGLLPNLVKEVSAEELIEGHIRVQELALARCEEAENPPVILLFAAPDALQGAPIEARRRELCT